MNIRVFIQSESGSNLKHDHNEKTLEFLGVKQVSRRYPYPYGFVIGTSAPDSCNVDCFIVTSRKLRTGQIVDCEPIGLMEQLEDGIHDHSVLARLGDEQSEISPEIQTNLIDFVTHVFDDIASTQIAVGSFRRAETAISHIEAYRDP